MSDNTERIETFSAFLGTALRLSWASQIHKAVVGIPTLLTTLGITLNAAEVTTIPSWLLWSTAMLVLVVVSGLLLQGAYDLCYQRQG